jgi:hypothetical protein
MKELKEALAKAQEGLGKVRDERSKGLDGSPGPDPQEIEKTLLNTLEELVKDLVTIGKGMEETPAWLMRSKEVIDYEVLTVIVEELTPRLRINTSEDYIEIEDSRYFQSICMDAAHIFTKHHHSDDLEYWHRRQFLDEVFDFCGDVIKAMAMDKSWVNRDYRQAHGSDTLDKLLRKYYELKHPMMTLDMAEVSMSNDKIDAIKALAKGIQERAPDISQEIERLLTPGGSRPFDSDRVGGSVILFAVSEAQEIRIDLQSGRFESFVDGVSVKDGSVRYVKKG